jgi:sulfur relay protein TusB/DsrH
MLHIIDNFPIPPTFLDKVKSGDTIIFTDDAVLTVKQENFEVESLTQKAFSHINLCVRKTDLLIRNISNKDLFRRVVILDDFQYNNVISQDLALKSYN